MLSWFRRSKTTKDGHGDPTARTDASVKASAHSAGVGWRVASPTDLREQLQSSLGGAYALERELAGDVSAERFRREVHLTAGSQHPHVVPVLAAGSAGGLLQ